MRRWIFVFGLTAGLAGCATSGKKAFEYDARSVSVMAYNVENLFDTQHDEGTEDYTFLPRALKASAEHKKKCEAMSSDRYRRECLEVDWSETVLKMKMERLADAILQVNNGRGPDLLIVEEVENQRVLERLNREHLAAAQYQSVVVLEGFDKRGIDVGFLSRFPLEGPPVLHKIAFTAKDPKDQEWMDRSRGILQGTFRLPDGTKLTAFAVHFPSQANPTYWREQAIDHLNRLMSALPEDHLAVAGGDFNISTEEDRRANLYGRLEQNWLVSHKIGCGECRGTHYWHTGRSWSFLDALLFKKSMSPEGGSAPWVVDPMSIGIPRFSVYQTNRFKSPARFDENQPMGVSDHWPIFAVLRPRSP